MLSKLVCLASLAGVTLASLEKGLTVDFSEWLNENGYGHFKFERLDLSGGAYGGKATPVDKISHNPVVFIHGNSDIAVGDTTWQTGWTTSIGYFLDKGYTKGELYATTWGPGDADKASDQTHSKEYLEFVRGFLDAVLKYTGAAKIDIISHSMGVTLARRAVQGGQVTEVQNPFNLGPLLAGSVGTFIGIAGANWGLTTCYYAPVYDTCSATNGFYPGYAIGPLGLSNFLYNMNHKGIKEADNTFAVLSTADELIGFKGLVWGQYTGMWPKIDGALLYSDKKHIDQRDAAADQFFIISTQTTPILFEEDSFLK